MVNCNVCKARDSRTRVMSAATGVCQECEDKKRNDEHHEDTRIVIDDESKLGDLTFSAFKSWFRQEIQDTVKEEVEKEIAPLKKDIESMKSEVTANLEKR